MIEELHEYLIRKGVSNDLADDVSIAYYDYNIIGVRLLGYSDEFDADEMEELVKEWQIEAGE